MSHDGVVVAGYAFCVEVKQDDVVEVVAYNVAVEAPYSDVVEVAAHDDNNAHAVLAYSALVVAVTHTTVRQAEVVK